MLDKYLEDLKKEYREVKPPKDMEARLKNTLDIRPKRTYLRLASIIFILLIFAGYNSNSLARVIKGEGDFLSENYKDLNEEAILRIMEEDGFQKLDYKYEFKGGSLVLDGILVNKLGINFFYSVDKNFDNRLKVNILDGDKKVRDHFSSGIEREDGKTYWSGYSQGRIRDSLIYFRLEDLETSQVEEIGIDIDKYKLVKGYKEIKIKENLKIDGNNYRFKTLKVTPVSLVIEGENESILELGLRKILARKRVYKDIHVEILLDSKKLETRLESRRSNMSGRSFSFTFDNPNEGEIKDLIIRVYDHKLNLVKDIHLLD